MEKQKNGFDLGWLSDCRNELYGFAILWIMVFHGFDWNHFNYSFGHTWLNPLRDFINLGNCGVDLFLLLSGISLYFSFARSQETLGFYKKRYLRLFPALWIVNGAYWFYLFVKEALDRDILHAGGHFIARITQLSFWFGKDRQVWYVAAIAVFYFLYPFIYHFLFDDEKKTGRRLAVLVCVTIISLLSIRLAFPDMYKRTEIAWTRLPVFCVGCALGKLVYERRKISWWWLALPILIVFGMMLLFAIDAFQWDALESPDTLNIKRILDGCAVWRYILGAFGVSVTFLMGLLLHFLSWKPIHAFLKFLGNISLELYLAHVTVHHVALLVLDKGVLSMVQYYTVILICIPIAFATMKIENAILKKN